MKLLELDNYEVKVSDEALLVKPIRKLFNMDRSQKKERFFEQMSILYFCYDPRSNYSYIIDDKERLKEVLAQEGIKDFKPSPEFKQAVEIYKKLCTTASSMLLEDTKTVINKMREVLKSIDFSELDEEKKASTVKTVASIVAMIPKLVKDLSDAEKAVQKEIEEDSKVRGSQELTIFDNDID